MNGLVNRMVKLIDEYAVDPFAKKAQMYCQKRPKLIHLVEVFYRMLKLIEEYAVDPFAKKAQMYCQKRPKLIHLVKVFYRMYRALAERYDQKNGEDGDEALIRRIADLELELQETKQKLNGDNNTDLLHKITVYEGELNEANEKISEMRAERDALREETEKREEKIKEMEKHMKELHMEQVRLRRRSSELSEEVEKKRVAVLEVAEQKREEIRLLCASIDYYKNKYERSMPNNGHTFLRILGIKY